MRNIPVICITEKTLAEAYEVALVALYEKGTRFKDHWVKNMNDSKDTRWEYTCHGRLAYYGVLKIKPQTIYAWTQKGQIPAVKLGKEWRFRKDVIDEWLNQRLMKNYNPS